MRLSGVGPFVLVVLTALFVGCSGGNVSHIQMPPVAPGTHFTNAVALDNTVSVSAYGVHLMTVCQNTESSTPCPRPSSSPTYAPAPAPTGPVSYWGGPALTAPQVYLVYWGWQNDPYNEASYLNGFASGIGGSPWLNTITQYYQLKSVYWTQTASGSAGSLRSMIIPPQRIYITNPSSMLAGIVNDTNPAPSSPTWLQVAQEAIGARQYVGNPNALYVILTSSGVQPQGFGGVCTMQTGCPIPWCGYHGMAYTGADTPTDTVSAYYAYVPYIPDAPVACSTSASTPLDGASIVAGHEIAEAITDPQEAFPTPAPSIYATPHPAWAVNGANSAEIGDLCAWQGLAKTSLSTGAYMVQPLWSNASNSCVLKYP